MKKILIGLLGFFLAGCLNISVFAQSEAKPELPEESKLHLDVASDEPVSGKQIFIPAKDRGFFGGEKDIKLEVTLYKPRGKGPFPLAILNHGSTGNNPGVAKVSFPWAAMGKFLMEERGFVVLAPMRRGRGASDGNNEESEPENTSCNLATNIQAVGNAMQDLDAVVAFAKTQTYIDMSSLVLKGVSRGGLLSVVYASERPQLPIKGVVNFVGGWSNDRCEGINDHFFQRAGKNNKAPSLWIYGERDANYSDESIRSYVRAFDQGDGNLIFKFYPNIPVDGHRVSRDGKLWIGEVRQFLDRIGFPKK